MTLLPTEEQQRENNVIEWQRKAIEERDKSILSTKEMLKECFSILDTAKKCPEVNRVRDKIFEELNRNTTNGHTF